MVGLWYNQVMIVIFFAFVVFLTWGVGDIFTTKATRKMGSFNATFYSYVFGALFSALYIPFAIGQLTAYTPSMIFLSIGLAIIQLLAFFAYNEGLKVGNSSIVGTIGGSFTALVVILSLLFFGERLSIEQGIAITITFIGLVMSSLHINDIKNKTVLSNKGTIYGLIAMVGWAIYFTFIKIPVQKSGFFWPTITADIVASLVFFLFGIKRLKMPKLSSKSGFPAVALAGLLLTIGAFSFNFAIGRGLSSIVAPIAGAYPALFAFLANIVFKDPITKQQKLGMIVTLCGVIALAYFSS